MIYVFTISDVTVTDKYTGTNFTTYVTEQDIQREGKFKSFFKQKKPLVWSAKTRHINHSIILYPPTLKKNPNFEI